MLRAQRVAAEAREDAAKGRALDEAEASRDLLCCCLMLQTLCFGCCLSYFCRRRFVSSVSAPFVCTVGYARRLVFIFTPIVVYIVTCSAGFNFAS